jgi:hypothetical protein
MRKPTVLSSALTAFILVACACRVSVAASLSGSNLSWGDLSAWESSPARPPTPALARVLEVAKRSLHIDVQPIARFHLAGTLNKDPAHQQSDRAKQNFPQILDLAVCGRVAPEPWRERCLGSASSALLAWARTYRPGGNPVDDGYFAPLLQSVDLVESKLSSSDRNELLDWVRSFALAGDRFYAEAAPRGYAPKIDNIRFNNFMAWHVYIRALSNTVAADRPSLQETRSQLSEILTHTFVPGANGTIDGTTYDFVQRDSLHYHVYDLEPLVWMSLLTPSVIDRRDESLIDLGLNFLKPYFLGEKQHVEFEHSVSEFDFKRIRDDVNNPTFRMKPWNPSGARTLLFVARQIFPDIRPWTVTVVDEQYDPSIELFAHLRDTTP